MRRIRRTGALALLAIAVACSAPERQEEFPDEPLGTTRSALVGRYEGEHLAWSGTENVDGEVREYPAPTHRYFWSDSYVAQSHGFLGGSTTIRVRAAGELLGGVGPHIVVTVGGTQVGSAYVNQTSYTSKSFTFNAASGTQEIRVRYDNDDASATQDRNLLLDWIEVEETASTCGEAVYEAESVGWSGVDGVDGEVRSDPPPTHRYLWTDTYLNKEHAFAAGPTRIRVRAKGELLDGVGPHIVVSVGGTEIGSAFVEGVDYVDKTFEFNATAGLHEIRVAYDNDDWIEPGDPGHDRNLLVDKLQVLCGSASSDGGASDGGSGADAGSGTDAGDVTRRRSGRGRRRHDVCAGWLRRSLALSARDVHSGHVHVRASSRWDDVFG